MNNGTVRARVTKLVGNFMPPIKGSHKDGTPLPRIPIYVLKGKHRPFTDIQNRPPLALFLTAYTASDGTFEVSVPPGIYTIVAEIDGQLYLNQYSADGYWWYIQIQDGQTIRHDITDTSQATC